MNRVLAVTGPLIVLWLALLPGATPATAEEIALIDDIVVDGQRPEEPTADNLSIVVAATGQTRTAKRGMGLSAEDEVRTGAGVQAVLRFLNLEPEVDPLIFVDENSHYQVVDSTTVQGFFGRLFASVSGLFTVIVPGGKGGVKGTEFEVEIGTDGAVEIEVLDGVVTFEPDPVEEAAAAAAAPPPPAEPAGPGIEIRINAGDQKTVGMTLTVNNGCPESERFFIDSPAELPWVEVVAEPVEVPAGGAVQAETEIWIDTAGVAPGVHRGAIVLRCQDCDTCSLTRGSAPLVIKVVGPPEEESRPAPNGGEAVEALRIEARERLGLGRGRRPEAPEEMAEEEVVDILHWTDDVFVAVQPTYAAAGDPPHFEDVEERSRAFRSARYEAVWREDPKARALLGNVYKDWGEDRRASKAYQEAAAADGSLEQSADFVASWAEANRRAGRLETAREQAERAVDLNPGSGRALVALGNVYRGFAKTVTETGDPAEEELYLNRSVEAYKAASETGDPGGTDGGRRTLGVAETNLAEAYTELAKGALARGETATADRRLIEAQQAVRAADSAYSKAENPFLLLAEGQIQQERARLARLRGDEEGSKQQLELAQKTYSQALERHRDLAPAHYRIATVYEDRGDTEQAESEYEKSVETQPTYSPSYDRLGKLKETKSPGSGAVYLDRDRKFVSNEKFISVSDVAPPAGTRPVPDLAGLARQQAVATLDQAGFVLGGVNRAPGAGAVGTVVAQRPAAGRPARAGTQVDLTLALPSGSFRMPDLRGMSVDLAQQRLADYGLGPATIKRIEKKGETRVVVTGHSPRPGRKTSAGKAVELEVTVPKPVKVPGLEGESQREAVERLRKNGLVAGEITLEISCAGAGRVLRQEPGRGTRLPRGSTVALVVATPGPDARPVPGVIGASRRDAEALLSRAGFRLGDVVQQEDDRPVGTVLAQRPAARTVLGAGCPVALTIARPVALVQVPRFVGESLQEIQRTAARVALALAGVEVGRITYVDSHQYPAGTVVRQRPAAGSQVRRGSRVDLWVARGAPNPPAQVTVPNLKCKSAAYAAEVLKEMGLRYSSSGQGREVVRQSPPAGSRVSPGTVVTLYLNYCVR